METRGKEGCKVDGDGVQPEVFEDVEEGVGEDDWGNEEAYSQGENQHERFHSVLLAIVFPFSDQKVQSTYLFSYVAKGKECSKDEANNGAFCYKSSLVE